MSLTAADIMTRNVRSVRPSESVAKVARLLSDHSISAVPVCDEDDTVVGMISEGDLIRPIQATRTFKRSWWLHILAEGEDLAPSFLDCIRMENHRVADLMVSPAITASPNATVSELAELLVRHRIKRLPIVVDNRIVGVVSRADLIRVFASTPDSIAEAL